MSSETIHCRACGASNQAQLGHCASCGSPLPAAPAAKREAPSGLDFDFELDLGPQTKTPSTQGPPSRAPDSRRRALPPAAGSAERTDALAVDGFDLDLADVPPAAAPAQSSSSSMAANEDAFSDDLLGDGDDAGLSFGSDDSVDSLQQESSALDVGLDLDEAELREKRRHEEKAAPSRPSNSATESGPDPAPESAPNSLVPETQRIAEIAAYGPVPSGWLQTVPYSWRVWKRRNRLRGMHRHQLELHAATEQRVHLGAEAVVLAVKSARAAEAELEGYLAPMLEAERVEASRAEQKASSDALFSKRREALMQKSREISREREQLNERLKQKRVVLEDKQAARARAAADLKRAERDLEAAYAKADAAASQGQEFASPEDAERIRELEGMKAQREERQTGAHLETVAAKKEVAEWLRKIKELEAIQRRHRQQQQALEREAEQTGTSRERDVQHAHALRLQAAHDVAYRLLSEKGDWLTANQRETLREAAAELEHSKNELNCHEQAIDAYLQDAFRKGWALQAAAAVLLIVGIFVAMS